MNSLKEQMAAVKFGVVVEAEKGQVKVQFADMDDLVTDWLPVSFARTLQDQYYALPDPGDHVVCIMDENFEDGAVLGAVYDDENPPPDDGVDIIRYANGTVVKIDRESGDVTIDTPGNIDIKSAQNVNITAADNVTVKATSVTIDAPNTEVTGHLRVRNGISAVGGKGITCEGGITATGDIVASSRVSLTTHVHGGVDPGGGTSGEPI